MEPSTRPPTPGPEDFVPFEGGVFYNEDDEASRGDGDGFSLFGGAIELPTTFLQTPKFGIDFQTGCDIITSQRSLAGHPAIPAFLLATFCREADDPLRSTWQFFQEKWGPTSDESSLSSVPSSVPISGAMIYRRCLGISSALSFIHAKGISLLDTQVVTDPEGNPHLGFVPDSIKHIWCDAAGSCQLGNLICSVEDSIQDVKKREFLKQFDDKTPNAVFDKLVKWFYDESDWKNVSEQLGIQNSEREGIERYIKQLRRASVHEQVINEKRSLIAAGGYEHSDKFIWLCDSIEKRVKEIQEKINQGPEQVTRWRSVGADDAQGLIARFRGMPGYVKVEILDQNDPIDLLKHDQKVRVLVEKGGCLEFRFAKPISFEDVIVSVEDQPVTFTLKRVGIEGNEHDILQTKTKGGGEVHLIHKTSGVQFLDAMDIVRLYFDSDTAVIVINGVKFVASQEQEIECVSVRRFAAKSSSDFGNISDTSNTSRILVEPNDIPVSVQVTFLQHDVTIYEYAVSIHDGNVPGDLKLEVRTGGDRWEDVEVKKVGTSRKEGSQIVFVPVRTPVTASVFLLSARRKEVGLVYFDIFGVAKLRA